MLYNRSLLVTIFYVVLIVTLNRSFPFYRLILGTTFVKSGSVASGLNVFSYDMNQPSSVWFTGVWLSECPGYNRCSVTVWGRWQLSDTYLVMLDFLAFERNVQLW